VWAFSEVVMPNVTASEAGRHFGKMLREAQRDPVFISKGGEQTAVLLSFDAFRRILAMDRSTGVRPIVEKLLQESIQRHGDVYAALAKLD
jgi:prevent-host-death family protein